MSSDVNKPEIAKDEPRSPAPGNPLASLPFVILAALTSGTGAFLGGMIGKHDGIPWSIFPLGIFGMVLISGAVTWIISPKWRRSYVAALPMYWLMIGGGIVSPLFVNQDDLPIAMGVITSMGLLIGMPVGQHIANGQSTAK